jgi:hypothetical protein
MAPISQSKDGIVHNLVSDDSAPRVRLFRQSVRSLRRLRTVQSDGDPNQDSIHPPIPLENVSPRTRHRLLRILRTSSVSSSSESQDSGSSDGLPSIQSLARCSLPQDANENIPCFSMMVDENPFRSEHDEAREGDEDRSMISSMSPDSARLYLQSDPAGAMRHAFPPVEIFVQRPRIPTDEWQDSWIRGVGPSSTPMALHADSNPSAPWRPPPIVTVVDMPNNANDPPGAPKHESKNDFAEEVNSHLPTEDMNLSPDTRYSRPMVPTVLVLPSLSPLPPTALAPHRCKPPTTQNRAQTTTSHMVRRPLQSSPRMIGKPQTVQKVKTSPPPPDAVSHVVWTDPVMGRLPRRRDPAAATSVFSFGSIVGESTLITPMSWSSSSFSLDERRSTSNPPRRVSVGPTTPLRGPVPNVDNREDEGVERDHPMKVFETFLQSDPYQNHLRKKTPLQNDLDYCWRHTKRFWYPAEKPVALQRNRSGCLT